MIIEWLLSVVVCSSFGYCEEYVVQSFPTVDSCLAATLFVDTSGADAVMCEKTIIVDDGEEI